MSVFEPYRDACLADIEAEKKKGKRVTHELKTLPAYWDAVKRGEKTFEVRRDDRGFQKGDKLRLLRMKKMYYGTMHEVEIDSQGKPLHVLEFEISYILTGGQFGIEPGYVVIGLKKVL